MFVSKLPKKIQQKYLLKSIIQYLSNSYKLLFRDSTFEKTLKRKNVDIWNSKGDTAKLPNYGGMAVPRL